MTKLLATRTAWVLVIAAAAALLVVGSIGRPVNSTAARISHLDSVIRCPACEDLSIAESDAPSSVTLRNEVAAWVRAGWSDSRIEQAVVARYGPGGLLLPPASGVETTLYLVPLAFIGAAAAGLGWFLWRRHHRFPATRAGVPGQAA
jgi:cytochrome c-type biogenesis protein CcmH